MPNEPIKPIKALDIEATRSEAIAENLKYHDREEPGLQRALDTAVETIQANRGHIGGVMLVLLPKAGDVIVDPLAAKACDGLTVRHALNEDYHRLLVSHAEGIPQPWMQPNPLERLHALMSGLGGGADE